MPNESAAATNRIIMSGSENFSRNFIQRLAFFGGLRVLGPCTRRLSITCSSVSPVSALLFRVIEKAEKYPKAPKYFFWRHKVNQFSAILQRKSSDLFFRLRHAIIYRLDLFSAQPLKLGVSVYSNFLQVGKAKTVSYIQF